MGHCDWRDDDPLIPFWINCQYVFKNLIVMETEPVSPPSSPSSLPPSSTPSLVTSFYHL